MKHIEETARRAKVRILQMKVIMGRASITTEDQEEDLRRIGETNYDICRQATDTYIQRLEKIQHNTPRK